MELRTKYAGLYIYVAAALYAIPAYGQNKPCSGAKGGINHCRGSVFICNDGSTSASKKDCSTYAFPAYNAGKMMAAKSRCLCRQGRYCIGPRGGRYCLSDNGTKSYKRY